MKLVKINFDAAQYAAVKLQIRMTAYIATLSGSASDSATRPDRLPVGHCSSRACRNTTMASSWSPRECSSLPSSESAPIEAGSNSSARRTAYSAASLSPPVPSSALAKCSQTTALSPSSSTLRCNSATAPTKSPLPKRVSPNS
jgi:hypothetical protein